MKRLLFFCALFCATNSIFAQNVQLLYDFGKGRNCLTSTVEMFKPDKYGSTFLFIDMDYGTGGVEGVSMAYWEIARSIKFRDHPFALHIEYNGGFWQHKEKTVSYAHNINDSWLGGLEFSKDAKDSSKGFTFQALYKYIRGRHDFSFQLTGIWYMNFWNNRFSFTGFADFWREEMEFTLSDGGYALTKFIFQAESQVWYNFTPHFSAGSEVEFSNNFAGKGFWILPTLGIKATF